MQRIIALIVLCLGFLSIWAQYDMVGEDYGNGLRRVKKGDYYGFIDKNQKEVIPVKYFYLEEFTNGKSLVVAGLEKPNSPKKYGMIDKYDEAVVPFKYDEIGFDYGNGLRRVKSAFKDKKNLLYTMYGFINENGKVVIPEEYIILGEFSGGKTFVSAQKPDESAFLIDKTGLCACPYRAIYDTDYNGLYIIENQEGRKGLFDGRTGNILMTPTYMDMKYPSEGMICVASDDWKYGYLDAKTLEMIIRPQYSYARDFSEGLAAVEYSDGEMGFINKQGETVIPFKYSKQGNDYFAFGFCVVSKTKEPKLAIINTKGEELTPYKYTMFLKRFNPMGFEAQVDFKKGTYHYFDHNGVQYDSKEERDMAQFEIMKKRAANGDERYFAALGGIYSDDEKCRALGLAGKNDELALQWYLKAAEIKDFSIFETHGTGSVESYSDISFHIGRFYEKGIGTKKNLFEAKQWYEKCIRCDYLSNSQRRRDALCRLRAIEGIIDMTPMQSSSYASIAWPKFQAETTQKEYNIEFDVNSDSKIEDITLLVNGVQTVQNRGIKTVESSNHDLTINQIVSLNEGTNTIKVSVRNAAGTTEEEKTVVYSPQGSGSPTIEWLEYVSTTDKKDIQIKLGIKSRSKVENVTINREQTRGIATVKTDGYDMIVNRTLMLHEGQNHIVVSVSNADGTATSEKIIEYKEKASEPVFKDRRIALVIGNSDYSNQEMKLKNPVNDANDIAKKLESLGFDVILKLDATLREIEAALSEFARRAEKYDVSLFFFAGHGIQSNGNNYLLPIDIDNLDSEAALKYKCLNAGFALDLMAESNCKLKIAILDACRNDPLSRKWHRGTGPKGLSTMDSPDGTIIAFSTAPGHTASDGTGRNSPYTEALLEALDRPNLGIFDCLQAVGSLVRDKTNKSQIPWFSTSFTGSFYFNQQ